MTATEIAKDLIVINIIVERMKYLEYRGKMKEIMAMNFTYFFLEEYSTYIRL